VEEWQTACKQAEAKGTRKLAKPKKPKDIPPLTKKELAELPELPERWGWVKFGNVVSEICRGKMLDKEKNREEHQTYLRNINVRWNCFDLNDLLKMRFESSEDERYGLEDGDLIICEGGEPGRAEIWKEQLPGMKIQKVPHRVRFLQKTVLNKYALYFIYYPASRANAPKLIK